MAKKKRTLKITYDKSVAGHIIRMLQKSKKLGKVLRCYICKKKLKNEEVGMITSYKKNKAGVVCNNFCCLLEAYE